MYSLQPIERIRRQDATPQKAVLVFRLCGSFHISACSIAGGERPIGLAEAGQRYGAQSVRDQAKAFSGIGLFPRADGASADAKYRRHPFLRRSVRTGGGRRQFGVLDRESRKISGGFYHGRDVAVLRAKPETPRLPRRV